jgi:flagellar protein FlaJ
MPELLERLASLNEAGMTLGEGIERVRGSDLGVLSPEIDRIWRDVAFGANIDDALVRFGRRVRTTSVTRVVTLLTHAHRASGRMGEVLRIAATQARADLRMRRQRRQQMLTYLVVIYISFVVFLVIIFAVNEVLLPSLPEAVPSPDLDGNRLGVNTEQFARLGSIDKAAYSLVFFHTALIQAVAAGFIAGQFGEGSLRDGAKHAAVLLSVAYLAFVLLSAPVASIGAGSAISTGETAVLHSASTSDGGFVVAYEDGVNSTELGRSEYLPPGTHRDVRLQLDRPIRENRTITLAIHLDTDGDRRLTATQPYLPGSDQVDRPYPPIAARGSPGVEVTVNYVGG